MITRLKLQNWRSHLSTDIDFSEGTNCFIGDMGTGKSSIMSGICFALFGTFPELQSKKLKLEDVIMKKPKKQDQSLVELEFALNGDRWSVSRKIEKGRTLAELRKNDKIIEAPQPSKVTAEIENLLKINYDLFTRAIYSEQNQLDMFLTIPKGQRMKKIDELLSIDKFEQARATAKLVINKCANAVEEKVQLIKNLESDSSLSRLPQLKAELKSFLENVRNLKDQLGQTKYNKEIAKKNIEVLKEQQVKVNTVKDQMNMAITLIKMTEKDIDNAKEDLMEYSEETTEGLKAALQNLVSETSELEYALGKERENLSLLSDTNAKGEARMSLLKDEKIPELEKLSKELKAVLGKVASYESKRIEKEFNKSKEDLEKTNIDVQVDVAKITEIEESLNELKNVSGQCPVCDNKLSPQKKAALESRKKKQLEDLKKEVSSLKVAISKTEGNIEKLEQAVKDYNELQQRAKYLKGSDAELAKFEKELIKLENSMKTHLKQKKMQEKAVEMLQKQVEGKKVKQERIKHLILKRNEVEAKMNKLEQLKSNIIKLEHEKSLLSGFSPSILDRYENDFKNIIVLEKEIETKIDTAVMIISDKDKIVKELETKESILNNLKSETKRISAISDQMMVLESALVLTQEELRKNFIKSVNTAIQAIWSDIYPYKDFYGARLGIEGGDYVLQLQDSTGWVPADGVASGGERSIACLALRIAFSLVLAPQLKWIVLDEPTHNLDAKAVDELGNVLREKVTSIVEQIFLITHDPSLESAVSGYLYRLDREKGKDGFTRITKISGPN